MFNQQLLVGTINLALPIIVLYWVYPSLLHTFVGQLAAALFLGAFIYYNQKQLAVNQIAVLRYVPTGTHKEAFDGLISQCGVDPQTVQLRYAYNAEQTALANASCIIVDPLVWQGLLDDPQAQEVQIVFEKYIEPTLAPLQKQRINALRQKLNPKAGNFIFRHELGHVVQRQTARKLVAIAASATVAAYTAIAVGMALVPISGFLALAVALPVGMIADYTTTFVRNYFWQQKEEKAADAFAINHSTTEEIKEAAAFLKYQQEVLDTYPEKSFIKFPQELTSGHPHGSKRYAYLMAAAQKKGL